MKLNLENDPRINLINAYGERTLTINKVVHEGNLLLDASNVVSGWAAAGFEGLSETDFTAIVALRPEVVLIGTGARLRFPSPRLLRPLMEARIGYEVMDLPAACRTYNVLVSEGRAVAAALLFD